jgi:hypothetical protein
MSEQKNKTDIITYSFEDAPTLYKFYNSYARIIGVRGPVGSGKSSVCVWKLIKHAREQQPHPRDGIRYTRWAVVRNSYPQLKDSTIRKVLEWLPAGLFGTYKIADHDYIIDAFPGCIIELSFRALDTPKHVRNLLSVEFTGAWINEAREIPKVIFDALDTRINRYNIKDVPCTWSGIMMDTNAPEEDSWWHQMFEIDKPDNAEEFIQPGGRTADAENVKFLPEDYYSEIIKGKDKEWLKVYIDNEYGFVKEGELVYESTWVDSLHMAKDTLNAVPGREIVVGLDFGLTPSAIFTQVTPRGHFNVLEEYVSDSMGIKRFGLNILKPLIMTKYKDYKVIFTGDPAGSTRSQTDEKTCYEEIMEIFPNHLVYKANTNSIVSRVGAVESFLTQLGDMGIPCLQLSPNCTELRKGFNKGYVKDKLGNPKKNRFSHPHDALQYAALYFSEHIRRDEKRKAYPTKKRNYMPATHIGL